MTGTLIVNNLAGLLIVSSLLVIGARQPKNSALFYALQSFILVLIFIALAYTMHAEELFLWSGTAFVTKVLLVPYIMYKALGMLHKKVQCRASCPGRGTPSPKGGKTCLEVHGKMG